MTLHCSFAQMFLQMLETCVLYSVCFEVSKAKALLAVIYLPVNLGIMTLLVCPAVIM